MNCNRPFHYSIMPSQRAPWTTNFIYILYPWENFCQRFSKSKKKTLILKDTVVDISFVIRSAGLDSFTVLTFIFFISQEF